MKRMSLHWVILIVSLSLSSCGGGGGGTPDSLLDPTFGDGGKATTAIGVVDDEVASLRVQADGKLVAAGYSYDDALAQYVFALVRYNTDGSLDTNFGIEGITTIDIGSVEDKAFALAIQPSDGKLVMAGYSFDGSQNVFALVRYNTDGSLDTTFNLAGAVPGVVTTAVGTIGDKAFALVIQSDNKLVAAGYSDNGSQSEFALVRYNTDGSLDTTFNPAGTVPGVVTTAVGTIGDKAFALAIQSDNKLVAAGYSDDGSQFEFALVRYNTNGSLDTAFNPTGTVPGSLTTVIGGDDAVNALAIQPSDGRLVAAGYSYNSAANAYEFASVRYNTDGSLDTTFNATGKITTAIGTIDDEVYSLVIQSDGKLVEAGYTDNGTQFEFALVRYNTDGSLDPTFNTTGKITTVVGDLDAANALAIQPDDKLVAAGYSYNNNLGQYEFAVVRYSP